MKQINIFRKIKNASNIISEISVYVNLVNKGRNYWGICPFHEDTSPSMSVSPEKQFFKCFSCQKSGDVIRFISEYEKISIVEASQKLADKYGIIYNFQKQNKKNYSQGQQKLLTIMLDAMNFFQYSLFTYEGKKAYNYLTKRGITQQDINKFSVGYSPKKGLINFLKIKGHNESDIINSSLSNNNLSSFFNDRIIFGIKDNEGQIVGFSGRRINSQATNKYINSFATNIFNKSKILYNYSNALKSLSKTKDIIIVEGFMDVIALNKAGILNVVSIMGISLTKEHLNYLKYNNIVLMLDSDIAGKSATIKLIKSTLSYNPNVFVIENTTNLDPDEYFRKNGKVALQKLINKKIHALDFVLKKYTQKFENKGVQGVKFAKSFIKDYLNKINEQAYKDIYIPKLSNITGIKIETILNNMKDSSIRPEIKDKVKNKQQKIITHDKQTQLNNNNNKPTNNIFIKKLFSAMINKPNLIHIFENNMPIFSDTMNIIISKYLISIKDGKDMFNIANKNELNKIIGYKDYYESPTTEEFKEILDIVNEISNKEIVRQKIQIINNKKISEEVKIKIINDLIKYKKEKNNE